jgi:hypothetical protein
MSKKQDFTGMAVGAYAVPLNPPVVVYAVQMEPAMTIGPTWPYVPQTITPEMIRVIIREELERFDRRGRKKRRRK